MAIYQSSILTDIRGSVGGLTFYTGQNGRIIRMRKRNINTNTLSQKSSRNFLVQSNNGYQGLSGADKGSWNAWATANFYSIRNSESVNKSGYIAYRSMQNVINTNNSKFIAPSLSGLPAVTPLTFTSAPLSFTSPPTGIHVQPNIIDAPGSFYPIVVQNVSLTHLNILNFDLQFGITPHVLLVNGQLQDVNSLRYVIEAFISNPGAAINFKYKSLYMKLIFASKMLTVSAPGLTGYSGVRYSADCTTNLTDSKYSILTNRYYYVTIVASGANGSQCILGTKCILTT
jgi:hypothetical protein